MSSPLERRNSPAGSCGRKMEMSSIGRGPIAGLRTLGLVALLFANMTTIAGCHIFLLKCSYSVSFRYASVLVFLRNDFSYL
jgi:hypothetical protein